ncbi:MAG: MaoC/PaaZ C-terminal domain-containing protein [Hyphomonadaceae bacterium]
MPIDYQAAMALKSEGQTFSYRDRETMLYALGIGMGADPMDAKELPFVYENGLKAMPTLATVVAWGAGATGKVGINYLMVVHGEQRLTVHKPMPTEAEITADWRLTDIVDKGAGKGAILWGETVLKEKKSGDKLVTLTGATFARGDGGFGGSPSGGLPPHEVPTRAPDAECTLTTRPDQALIYRLSGDRNPLHSDPNIAKMAGFDRPILHGLCTYGICCRAVLMTYADYDPTRIKAFDVRFSSPVFPGETIVVRMWKDGETVSFEANGKERYVTVIKYGRAVVS